MSNVENSGTVDSDDSFIHTDPPVCSYPSNNTAHPKGYISSPYPGVQQVCYHAGPVSIVTVNGHPSGDNTSLDTEFSHRVTCILQL